MKVIVFGAHSSVGEHVVSKLMKKGYTSCAVIGNENQTELLKNRGATDVVVYEEHLLTSLFHGYDAAIYLTGINPKGQSGKTVMVDHQSVIETVKEAEKQGVQRFVMMSAIMANETADDESREIGAKEMPDELLRQANLTYTVVQPGALTDKPGDGKISAAITLDSKELEISREDLAEVLVMSLEVESAFNKTFEVAEGDTVVSKALASL
ncbi:NAD-dependent epimerase/dehydratase family protein [Mesobacillus boroniphilus]|uniref:NAD-dependent epimerase/dehydratase family protein n=1 Tax=Mesobacillus boroniphilus TaxID=308892 RepID=A0A944GYI7_9BACI|nr:NAD(P)H-binding protein [Mesobacillus boroniphilus]MBS8266709.1 NAD-dependent epimerase/dehydratase family protein [Mesobacillus boroniphilus]